MMAEKQSMQADGQATVPKDPKGPASAGRPDMEDNVGHSGGGAYPNPYLRDGGNAQQDEGFHGGQSIMGYHGTGQLGSEDLSETENAPAEED